MKVRIIDLLVFLLAVSLLVMALLACTSRQSTETAAGTPLTAEITGRASSPVLNQGIGEYGVSFQYDPYLAASLKVEVVPGLTAEQASGFTQLVAPDHLVFTFVHTYADQQVLYRQAANLDAQPHIAVYPVEAYAAMNELAREQGESLRSLLTDKPPKPGAALPFLPTVNAAQALQAQLAYLSFLNGSGLRYLTQVAQEARPVNNQELFYTFQGLTDDGAYYVAAFFPVSTTTLPDDAAVADDEAFNATFADYLAETRTALDGLSSADFTPNLSLLDAVVTSLRVEPDVELLGGQTLGPAVEPTPMPVIAAPVGLAYSFMDGLWRIEPDEQPQQLLEITDYRYLLPAPDLAHAVYMDDGGLLWLVDLADSSKRQLAEGVALAWLYQWGDARTLLLGVWLNPEEEEGNSTGHLATLDIDSGELQVVDDRYLSLGRPAMALDGQAIAYDISPFYKDVSINGRLYHPESGSQPFDPTLLKDLSDERPWHLSNPAWSPDGTKLAWKWSSIEGSSSLVVFDLTQQTTRTLFTWQPKGFGALPPSPTWSFDGQWLAIEIWANNQEESGLWLLATDGSSSRRISTSGSNPHWLGSDQLVYAVCDENQMCTNQLFDLETGKSAILDLPPGTILLAPSTTLVSGKLYHSADYNDLELIYHVL